jgi:hypothetical protein
MVGVKVWLKVRPVRIERPGERKGAPMAPSPPPNWSPLSESSERNVPVRLLDELNVWSSLTLKRAMFVKLGLTTVTSP